MEDVTDTGLQELMALAEELRPNIEVLPPMKRFLAGWSGSVALFTIFSIFYLSFVTTDETFYFILGALILSIVAGATSVLYRTDKVYKSALFGGGAGFIIAFIIGIFTGEA